MTEDLAGLQTDPTSPAGTPDAGAADIEKIRQEAIAKANADAEERIKGFQRLIAERDTRERELTRQLEEQRIAALPDSDREMELARRRDQEVDRLRAENELLKLMPEFPDVFPDFQRLLAASDSKAQLEFLRKLKQPQASTPPTQAPAPASVDPNNPAGIESGLILSDGTPMSADLAERVLRSASRLR